MGEKINMKQELSEIKDRYCRMMKNVYDIKMSDDTSNMEEKYEALFDDIQACLNFGINAVLMIDTAQRTQQVMEQRPGIDVISFGRK